MISESEATPVNPPIRIRRIEHRDLDRVAQIHVDALPDSMLTYLGRGTTYRFYEWLLDGPHELCALAAEQPAQCLVGFLFGGNFRTPTGQYIGAFPGFLRQNLGYVATQALRRPHLWSKPRFREHVATSMRPLVRARRPDGDPAAAGDAGDAPAKAASRPFGVQVIAVDSRARGTGVGRALMTEAASVARHLGTSSMRLTVEPNNLDALRFYKKLGWTPEGEPWTGVMTCQLPEPAGG